MSIYFDDGQNKLLHGNALDCLQELPDNSVRCCVTSPPYWRQISYGMAGEIGREGAYAYMAKLTRVFSEMLRVLTANGTLWLNVGDKYIHGEVANIPHRLAEMLRHDGWRWISTIVWNKSNPMPESIKTRPTKSHEYIFLMAKQRDHFYNYADAKEPSGEWYSTKFDTPGRRKGKTGRLAASGFGATRGIGTHHPPGVRNTRNWRDVWVSSTAMSKLEHFAPFPLMIPERAIIAGSEPEDLVLDPFVGSGTTAVACLKHNRRFVGIDINETYLQMTLDRIGSFQHVAS